MAYSKKGGRKKNDAIKKFIKEYQFDAIGLSETNLNWPLLDPTDRWEERVRGLWETSHHSIAFNETDATNHVCQPGGCVQVSCNRLAH